jgi:hypothetical protein
VILEEPLRQIAPRGFDLEFRADVLIAGEKVDELPISSGNMTDEADAEIRRRCNLVVPGLHDYIPSTSSDYLWPVGNIEVGLVGSMDFGRGVVSGDLPLGVYRVQKPRIALLEGGDRAISFEGYDRAMTVQRAKLRSATTLAQGVNIGEFIFGIVEDRLPEGSPLQFVTTDVSPYTIQWDIGDDPWTRCQELARGWGLQLYFDARGVCVLEEITDPIERGPDFVHTTGETLEVLESTGILAGVAVEERATVKSAEWTIDDEDAYNHIIVRGENTDSHFEVYGEAFDTDPNSPTWIGGQNLLDPDFGKSPFGDKLNVLTNQFVQTNQQATTAAYAELILALGLQEEVSVRTFWLPHEANDIVLIKIPELEIQNTYVLDAVGMDFNIASDMQLSTRQRRTTGIIS